VSGSCFHKHKAKLCLNETPAKKLTTATLVYSSHSTTNYVQQK